MRNPRVLCNMHGNSPSGLRPRARACIFHKTLGLMLYLLHKVNYIIQMHGMVIYMTSKPNIIEMTLQTKGAVAGLGCQFPTIRSTKHLIVYSIMVNHSFHCFCFTFLEVKSSSFIRATTECIVHTEKYAELPSSNYKIF